MNPSDLILDLGSADIIEGKTFSVDGLCRSAGADPPSEYQYDKFF